MSKIESVKAMLPDGTLKAMQITVSEVPPWFLEYEGFDGIRHEHKASDLFEALRAMRKQLESSGCRLLCAGARIDATSSRMSRNMGGGRRVAIVHHGIPASKDEVVDIFQYAEPEKIGTVQQQQDFTRSWLTSLGLRLAKDE